MARELISVVDDDPLVRQTLPDVLRELGFAVAAFPSALEFLASGRVAETRCLLLDVVMPGMSGYALQHELQRLGQRIPIIYITGQTDRAVRPRLSEQGAVACLFKPFCATALSDALAAALRDS